MGTRTVTGAEIILTARSTIRNEMTDGPIASCSVGQTFLQGAVANGVSEGQFNRAWEDRDRSLASAATEDIDLYDLGSIDIGAGAGKDALGQDTVWEEIVLLLIKQTAGPGRLEINPTNPTNKAPWVPTLTVALGSALKEGGVFMMYQPNTDAFDITDASENVVRLGASGGDVEYDICIWARHDDDESSSSSSTSSTSSSTSSSSTSSTSSTSSSSTSSTSSSTT